MIIFLYGPDTYRSRQKLNEIIEHYKKIHKSGLNLKYFDLQKSSYQDFKDEIQQAPMFKEKKLLVLKNIFSNPDFKIKFLEQGKNFVKSDDIILIYEENKISESDSFSKFLKKEGKSQEFKLLEDYRLKNWVKKEFDNCQTEIDSKALGRLIDYVGNNLWQMANEIKKLVSYKKRGKIEAADIKLLVRPKIETDIFKTIDAISDKKKSRALMLLHQHLEKGDAPLYLLAMINFQFRNLLTIKELVEKNTSYYKIINKSKLNPFIVKKSYQQAQKFTLQQLKKIYQKIFQVDLNIKTGKLDPQTALDLLIAEI